MKKERGGVGTPSSLKVATPRAEFAALLNEALARDPDFSFDDDIAVDDSVLQKAAEYLTEEINEMLDASAVAAPGGADSDGRSAVDVADLLKVTSSAVKSVAQMCILRASVEAALRDEIDKSTPHGLLLRKAEEFQRLAGLGMETARRAQRTASFVSGRSSSFSPRTKVPPTSRRPAVAPDELFDHWSAITSTANDMKAAELITAFREWLSRMEDSEAAEPGSAHEGLAAAWSDLVFWDYRMWSHAEVDRSERAGERMLGALDPESRQRVQGISEPFRSYYALGVAERRRGGDPDYFSSGTDLARFARALWFAGQEESRDALGVSKTDRAQAMRAFVWRLLPKSTEQLEAFDDAMLESLVKLANTVPVKGERKTKHQKAPDDHLKWKAMMETATALGVRMQSGQPYSNVQSFRQLFGREWRDLSGKR